jgi:hypothetical protein
MESGEHRSPDNGIQARRITAARGYRDPHQVERSGSEEADNLTGVRVAPERALRKDQHAIPRDFEHAAAPVKQLYGCIRIRCTNLGRQTGGPGFVVSNNAVANRYVHDFREAVNELAGRRCLSLGLSLRHHTSG